MCEFRIPLCNRSKWKALDLEDQIFYEAANKTAAAKPNNFVNSLYQKMGKPQNLLKVALISDLHVDYSYTIGASNVCGKVACCRSDSGMGKTPETRAGKWGDYNCDLNERALDSMLEYIKNEIKPDAVLWGGDSIGHNLDSLTPDQVTNDLTKTTNKIKTAFSSVRVYPTIGNHDSYPMNIISRSKPHDNPYVNSWISNWSDFVHD